MQKKKIEEIELLIKKKSIIYDHKVKKTAYKFGKEFKLKTVSLKDLPDYIQKNKNEYKEWIDFDQN